MTEKRDRTEFAARLLAARKRAGLTQPELAKRVGVSQGTIGEAETVAIGSKHAPALATALGVSARWLATGEGEMLEKASWPFSIKPDRFLTLGKDDRDFVEQRLEEAIVLCEFRLTQMADLSELTFQEPPVIATTANPVRKNRDRLIDLTGTEAKRGSTGSKAFRLSKSGRRRDPK